MTTPTALQAVVDDLSFRLGRSIVVDDATLHPLSFSAQTGTLDQARINTLMQREPDRRSREFMTSQGIFEATEPVRLPANVAVGSISRWCLPLRFADRLLGFLWVIDDPELSDDQRGQCLAAAEAITESLKWLLIEDTRRLDHSRVLLSGLLSSSAQEREESADGLFRDRILHEHPPFRAAAVTVHGVGASGLQHHSDLLRARLQHGCAAGSFAVLALEDHIMIILSADAFSPQTPFAEALRATIGRRHGSIAVTTGLGPATPVLADAGLRVDDARYACFVASRVAAFDGFAQWDDLGVYSLGQSCPVTADSLARIFPAITELLAPHHSLYADTVRAYLDNGTDVVATAAALHVHRTTLYWRLARLPEKFGIDLTDGNVRLRAHVALSLAALIDATNDVSQGRSGSRLLGR